MPMRSRSSRPGRVGDVAGQDVLTEHLGGQLAPEVVAAVQPALVLEVPVDAVEVEGDPADAALGQRHPEVGELTQRRTEEQVLGGDGADLAGQHHQVVDRCLGRTPDDLEAGADVQRQHHVLVADRLEHRVPVAGQEAREALDVRGLEEADRATALLPRAGGSPRRPGRRPTSARCPSGMNRPGYAPHHSSMAQSL